MEGDVFVPLLQVLMAKKRRSNQVLFNCERLHIDLVMNITQHHIQSNISRFSMFSRAAAAVTCETTLGSSADFYSSSLYFRGN